MDLFQAAQQRGNCQTMHKNRESHDGEGNRDNSIALRQIVGKCQGSANAKAPRKPPQKRTC